MLREVELNSLRWDHIKVEEHTKKITLLISKSKTDQCGLGAKRSLTCCRTSPCQRYCPWNVLQLLKRVALESNQTSEFVFVNARGGRISKAQMVKGWQLAFDPRAKGHSARRTGASMYVRMGLPVQELAFLGRWKSSVVLTYAEEALEDVAANENLLKTEKGSKTPCRGRSSNSTDSQKVLATSAATPPEVVQDATPIATVAAINPSRPLWVATNNYKTREKVWHRVKLSDWKRPMDEWMVACGWTFAKTSANLSMETSLKFGMKKCRKCSRQVNEANVGEHHE